MSKKGRIAVLSIALLLCAFSAEAIGKDAKSTRVKLPDSAEKIHPLLIGVKVPALVLKNADGTPFNLNEAVAGKPAIIVFYRGGW